MHPWPELKWWDSGERQVVEEKIDDLSARGIVCCPPKRELYRALSATPFGQVRVAVIGQDPYPTPGVATGVAFSVARSTPPKSFPHTLRILFGEYSSDLGLPTPSHGDLHSWTRQGVLLWNAIPCCQPGKPLSNDWDEWRYLTGEIVRRLDERGGVVFVCLGAVAASFCGEVDFERNRVIRTSHPSPRGIRASKSPFTGSRIFSTTNARLRELGRPVIDWEIKDEMDMRETVPSKAGVVGRVLPNVTGVPLGGLRKTATSPNIYTSLAF